MQGLSGQDLSGEESRAGGPSIPRDSSYSDKGYSRSPCWQKLQEKNIVAQDRRRVYCCVCISICRTKPPRNAWAPTVHTEAFWHKTRARPQTCWRINTVKGRAQYEAFYLLKWLLFINPKHVSVSIKKVSAKAKEGCLTVQWKMSLTPCKIAWTCANIFLSEVIYIRIILEMPNKNMLMCFLCQYLFKKNVDYHTR